MSLSEPMSPGDDTPAAASRSAPTGCEASTRSTVERSRESCSARSSSRGSVSAASQMTLSDAALVRIPVALEIAHQRRAQVAVGLLARIGGHVPAEHVERLLPHPDRAAVGRRVDEPRAGERLHARLNRRIHLVRLYGLVADQLGGRSPGLELEAREDRLA